MIGNVKQEQPRGYPAYLLSLCRNSTPAQRKYPLGTQKLRPLLDALITVSGTCAVQLHALRVHLASSATRGLEVGRSQRPWTSAAPTLRRPKKKGESAKRDWHPLPRVQRFRPPAPAWPDPRAGR
jgi:hypothetical protein